MGCRKRYGGLGLAAAAGSVDIAAYCRECWWDSDTVEKGVVEAGLIERSTA